MGVNKKYIACVGVSFSTEYCKTIPKSKFIKCHITNTMSKIKTATVFFIYIQVMGIMRKMSKTNW